MNSEFQRCKSFIKVLFYNYIISPNLNPYLNLFSWTEPNSIKNLKSKSILIMYQCNSFACCYATSAVICCYVMSLVIGYYVTSLLLTMRQIKLFINILQVQFALISDLFQLKSTSTIVYANQLWLPVHPAITDIVTRWHLKLLPVVQSKGTSKETRHGTLSANWLLTLDICSLLHRKTILKLCQIFVWFCFYHTLIWNPLNIIQRFTEDYRYYV